MTKSEVKEEQTNDAAPPPGDVDTAFTRERRETPRSPMFPPCVTDKGEIVITQSCRENDESSEGDDAADYGGSDGEDMRMLARPKHTSVVYMGKPPKPLVAGKSMEGKVRTKRSLKLVHIQDKSSPEQRKRKRLEIQKDINRRNETANKRQRSIEGLKRRVPFCETKTREVSAKELQAEKRAIEQELDATRTGGTSIVGPVRFPLGPLPWGKGKKKMPKNPPQEAASSPRGQPLAVCRQG